MQDVTVDHIGGDGLGTVYISSGVTMDLAPEETRTHIQSSVTIEGIVSFPSTVYAEQTVTCKGNLIGVEHWYSRGHTQLLSSGQSKCNQGVHHAGQYYFNTFTALSDGEFTFADETHYDVEDSIAIFMDKLHLEGQSVGYINQSVSVYSRLLEIEKQSTLSGTGRGYPLNSGPGAGCSNYCGSGGGHGGSGGGCGGCRSCGGGGTYDSNVLPALTGSGGGQSSDGHGGYGGSAVKLVHVFSAVEGTITMSGGSTGYGGGGGAGGSIWIDGQYVDGWGYLHANGGTAGSNSVSNCHYGQRGGGGGGGRIRSWGSDFTSKVLLHQRYVNGGSGNYGSGSSGSLYRQSGDVCSGHGTYNTSTLLCECNTGYVGYDCQFYCDDASTCDGNGVCNDQGQCECNPGFVGTHCESQCHRDVDCNSHGECSTCGYCICDPCYSGPDCSIECSGFGSCVANQCVCDDCHLGVLCESECNYHGTCDPVNANCTCDANWGDAKCTRKGCPGADLNCNGNGICNSGTSECFCNNGWKGKAFHTCNVVINMTVK